MDEILGASATHTIYAVQRVTCKSDHAINFINTFGRLGGFDKMMKIMEGVKENDHTIMTSLPVKDALPLISTFCECLGKASPLFHKTFAYKFMPDFIEMIKQTLLNSNPD